jgi:hypothetical protein
LTLGRGIIYSVHAQDLLQGIGGLSSDEVHRLDLFHGALLDLIRQSSNVFFAGVGFPYSECSRYTNISTNAVTAMLAIARLLNDEHRFTTMINGGDNSVPALVPWRQLFDHIIYGVNDGPMPGCVNNLDSNRLTSLTRHHDYQTAVAAPGEIADRFRNANPAQGIGYPMFTLERLVDSAEVLRLAGYGSGLGLSIVQAVVRGHGGELSLHDNAPQGLLVRIVLPRATNSRPDRSSAGSSLQAFREPVAG